MTGDLFPPTPRVYYHKAPLVQVTCQLLFPAVLRIERDVPAEFQERIRHAFPLFERANPFMPQLPPEIIRALPNANLPIYRFLTEDRKSTVELTPQSVALTTMSYRYWEKFVQQLTPALDALEEIYEPSFFTRIGLRYQDLIERSRIDLEGVPWSRLLRTEILGELAIKEIEENALAVSRALHFKLPSVGGGVLLRHGFGSAQGRSEVGYVIDLDFATEQKTEVANVQSVLSHLHERVGRAFRWCVTDELHTALDPIPIGELPEFSSDRSG